MWRTSSRLCSINSSNLPIRRSTSFVADVDSSRRGAIETKLGVPRCDAAVASADSAVLWLQRSVEEAARTARRTAQVAGRSSIMTDWWTIMSCSEQDIEQAVHATECHILVTFPENVLFLANAHVICGTQLFLNLESRSSWSHFGIFHRHLPLDVGRAIVAVVAAQWCSWAPVLRLAGAVFDRVSRTSSTGTCSV